MVFAFFYRFVNHPERSEGGVKKFCIGLCLRMLDIMCPSVFSSHISKARSLKIGMHNSYMDRSKVTDQIFDILSRSWDI